jgi:nitrile hydratase
MPLCGAALGVLAFPHLFGDLRTEIHLAPGSGTPRPQFGNLPGHLVSSEYFAYSPLMSEHHHDHDHSDLSETELRVRAIETILTEKGYVDPAALDLLIETYETKVGPRNGARVVARAWTDPAFRSRLIRDATPAIAELGFAGRQGEHIVALENTPRLHNMVVCTLCSCYPWPVLGLPPVWYKSAPYRSKAVRDPRGVLRDFGFELPDSTDIRVWDSTAEIRYLVLPMRPAGTDGWSEEPLAELVTRDSMIGTGLPKQPHEIA